MTPPFEPSGERARLTRDAIINTSALAVSAIAGVILVPVTVRAAGAGAYGAWVSASAIAGIASTLDLGLGLVLNREIALSSDRSVAPFIAAVLRLHFALTLAGALVIGAMGSVYRAPVIFWLAALSFIGDQTVFFASMLLGGFRRFVFMNGLIAVSAVVRVPLVIAIARRGGGIAPILAAQASLSVAGALVALFYAVSVDERVSFRHPFSWRELRERAHFAGMIQIAQVVVRANWQIGAPLAGAMLDLASAARYGIGQKFPLTSAALNWRAAEVLLPAASEPAGRDDGAGVRHIFEIGTRGTALVAMLPFVLLMMLAPPLLTVWMGSADPRTVAVLRLTIAAVFVDSLGYAAAQILWAAGAAAAIARAGGAALVINVVLTIVLLRLTDESGAAVALLLSLGAYSLFLVRLAARRVGMRAGALLMLLRGSVLAGLAAAGILIAVMRLTTIDSWRALIVAAAAASLAYGVVAFFFWTAASTPRFSETGR